MIRGCSINYVTHRGKGVALLSNRLLLSIVNIDRITLNRQGCVKFGQNLRYVIIEQSPTCKITPGGAFHSGPNFTHEIRWAEVIPIFYILEKQASGAWNRLLVLRWKNTIIANFCCGRCKSKRTGNIDKKGLHLGQFQPPQNGTFPFIISNTTPPQQEKDHSAPLRTVTNNWKILV